MANTKKMDYVLLGLLSHEPMTGYEMKKRLDTSLRFFWGGKSAIMGEKPKLQPYECNLEKYDRIIIGTPVWASNFAPPIRTFIHENRSISDKKIAVFTCFSGGGAEKAIDKMKKYIGVEKFEAELILVDPKENVKEGDDRKIEAFCSGILRDISSN